MTDPIDVSKIKAGDVVLVRMRFVSYEPQYRDDDDEPDLTPRLTVQGVPTMAGMAVVLPEDILSVQPRPLAVGDRVRSGGMLWKILAIVGDRAWVLGERGDVLHGEHLILRIADLERADG